MPEKATHMQYNETKSILPEDFDGVFKFTNATKEDFVAKWNSVEYTFPALKTTPLIIPSATPEEVQNIRKKFARELAEREFYGSAKFKSMNKHVPGGTPALYTEEDLKPFIQKCLEPLPMGSAKVKKLPKDSEDRYHKDEEGVNITRPLGKNESLVGQGTVIA